MKTADKDAIQPIFQLNMTIAPTRVYCYWCGQGLRQCGTCKGSGLYKGANCPPCKGHGCLCPAHEGDWDK
jgi:hypothetical protein